MSEEKRDPRILWSGDTVGILMDTGIMSFPSYSEPIPEKDEIVSHLRVYRGKSFRSVDYRRCMFRVQNDIGLRSDVMFGSIVTLTHQPSGMLVAGSGDIDKDYVRSGAVASSGNHQHVDEPLGVVYLLPQDVMDGEDTSHRWIISPRYNLREDGEPVRNGDYIYLRNVKYQKLFLASFPVSARNPLQHSRFEDLVGCASAEYVQSRPGLQVNILRKCPRILEEPDNGGGKSKKGKKKKKKSKSKKKIKNKTEEELEEERVERTTVFSGDFVRIYHREHRGHVICRVNDEDAFQSVVTPLGLVNRRRGMRKESTHGIYSRKITAQQPKTTLDFPITYSSLGLWQILPGDTEVTSGSEEVTSFSTIMFTKPVRLRHLVSGQYLALRPVRKADVADLKKFTSYKVRDLEEAARLKASTEHSVVDDGSDDQESIAPSSHVSQPASCSDPESKNDTTNDILLVLIGATAFDLRFSDLTTTEFDIYIVMEYGAAVFSCDDKRAATRSADSDDENVDNETSWNYVTSPESYSSNQITWKFSDEDEKTTLKVSESLIGQEKFIVKVMRCNDVGREITLATGEVMLPLDLRSLERDEEVECSLDLMELKAGKKFVGSLKVYLSSKSEPDKAAIENYLLGEYVEQAELDREILDTGDRDEEEQFQHYRNYEWVLGTCSEANAYSEFNLVEVDVNDREVIVNYGEMFAFEHRLTKQRLKLASTVGFSDCTPQWWEYRSDMAIVPVYSKPSAIRDAEVCQFERVDVDEVIDTLYCARFLSVARACTVSLQLTARAEQLYKPMFRQFQKSLQTLVLWTLGEIESDAALCGDNMGREDLTDEQNYFSNKVESTSVVIPKVLSKKNATSSVADLGSILFSSKNKEDTSTKEHPNAASSVFNNLSTLAGYGYSGYHATEKTEVDDEGEDDITDMKMGSSSSELSSCADKRLSRSGSQDVISNDNSSFGDETSTQVSEEENVNISSSSLAPWIGRTIARRTALFDEDSSKTALHRYVSGVLHVFLGKNTPMNATLYRRQVILAESMIIEQILHFINVLFLLQRAISSTGDERILKKYPSVPDFILVCTKEINNVVRASIYKNERVALKIISINGSFLSLMSQMIMGWDPPIQSILEMTCHDNDSSSDDGSNAKSAGSKEHSAEDVLVSAISEADVYQIVQQMMNLNVHHDPTATKILKLLTMLCQSGRARQHFQDLLIDAIAHNDVQPIVQGSIMAAGTRSSSLQMNSLLFYSRCIDGNWQVSFGNPYHLHSQEARDPAAYVRRAVTEASSLVNLFMLYNDNEDKDDMTLDLGECFNMLQDLGLGGPFLHCETRNLAGSSLWSMLKWWCYRYSFYYPSSSNSHCQLSPVHIMQVMGLPLTEALLANEALRLAGKSGNEYEDLNFFMDIINTEVTGLFLDFEETDNLMLDNLDTMIEEMMAKPEDVQNIDERKSDDSVSPRHSEIRKQISRKVAESLRKGQAHRKKMSLRHKRHHEKVIGSMQWLDVMNVFAADNASLRWFRQSLSLLAELCHGGNLNVQEKGTILVPAEFIMSILQYEHRIGLQDRSLLLKLLQNLYIVHDHVHPTRCLPVHEFSRRYNDNIVYCGYKEEIFNPPCSIGKVFNSLSRVKFYGDGAMDGASLRAMLYQYVKGSLRKIRLHYPSKIETVFVSELLELFHKLLKVGFFQEPDMHFFTDADSATTGQIQVEGAVPLTLSDKLNSLVGIRPVNQRAEAPRMVESTGNLLEDSLEAHPHGSDKIFTINDVKQLLIKRLNENTLIHQCAQSFKVAYENSSSKNSTSRKRERMASSEFQHQQNHYPVSSWTARTLAKRRRDFTKVKKSFEYFDSIHDDLDNIHLIHSAIQILETIHDMKQYLRLQKSWNYIEDVSRHFTDKASVTHNDSFSYFFDGINFESYFSRAFQADQHREPCPGYTQGVVKGTIYHSFDLRRSCYQLLNRELCLARDADLMMKSMSFIRDPATAFKHRLLSVFIATMTKNLNELCDRPFKTSTHHLERFVVALEHIRALCFTDFMGREMAENANEQKAGEHWPIVPVTPARRISRRFSTTKSAKFSTGSLGKPKRLTYSRLIGYEDTIEWLGPKYLVDEIPCLNPLDDEIQLAKEEYFNSQQRFNALCAEYQYRFHNIENMMGDSIQKLDCADALRRMSMRLVSTLERVTNAPHFMPWKSFYLSEKFIIDEIFGLLASIGFNDRNQRLCQSWFDQTSSMLTQYFPYSVGSTKLIAVFFQQCGRSPQQKLSLESHGEVNTRGHKSSFKIFATTILRRAVSEGLSISNTYSRFISALLQNSSKVAVQLGVTFYVPYVLKCSKRFPFDTEAIALVRDDYVLRNTFHYIVRPYRLCLERAKAMHVTIPTAMLQVGEQLYSKSFVNECLGSHEVSFGLKVDIIHIAFALRPDYEQHQLEDVLLPNLKRMRVALSIQHDAEVDASHCYGYCMEFLFDGVVKMLHSRLIQCSITDSDRVNYMIGAIITAESQHTAPNKPIATFIAEHLKKNVFSVASVKHVEHSMPSHDFMAKSSSEEIFTSVSDDDAASFSGLNELSSHKNVSRRASSLGQYVPIATVECFMMVLYILRLNNGELAEMMTEENTFQVLTVATSIYLLLRDYAALVISPLDNRPINAEVANKIKLRLSSLIIDLINESLVTKTSELLEDLFTSQTMQIARFNLNSLAISAPERVNSLRFTEEKEFKEFMELGKVYPAQFLRTSPLFRSFNESFKSAIQFLGLGGNLMFGDWRNATLNSKAFARKFGNYTYYDLWMRGGGRYMVSMFDYLGKVLHPTKVEYNLLHLLIQIMKHDVYEIQKMTWVSFSVRQQRIERELKRFQIVQNGMADLGANQLCVSVVGRALDTTEESFLWIFAPLTIAFANQVVAFQNQEIQEELIAQVTQKIGTRKPPEMNMLLGLQSMIRNCALKLSYLANPPDHIHHSMVADYLHPEDAGLNHENPSTHASTYWYQLRKKRQQQRSRFRKLSMHADWDHTKILRVVKEVFAFIGIFCKGDDLLSQNFFSAYQAESREFVDLIQELGSLANVCASKFISMIEYINDDDFYDRIAPPIWEAKDSSKRRFLAWEHPSNCMALFAQYLYTFTIVFDNMVGVFNIRTVSDLQQALVKIPEILEFTGLMQLNTRANIPIIGALGQNTHRAVRWHGGDPFRFYHTYFHEMSLAHLLTSQTEIDQITATLDKFAASPDEIFGISTKLFISYVRISEDKCLSTLLSFLDYATPAMANDLYLKLPENIMLQNMDNIFLIQRKKGVEKTESLSAVIVKYLSILEAMAIPIPDVGELIRKWREDCSLRGMDPRSVFATVEIIGKNDKVQRIFFPIPSFVVTFWRYPVVQRTKDQIVMQVNRNSAEEKLADFYEWLKKLVYVMKRQEILRNILTYPVHALFGGKTTAVNRFFPSIRLTAMTITVILNIYFAYYSSLPKAFVPPSDSYAYKVLKIEQLELAATIIRYIHIGMHASIALTSLLNSSAISDTFLYYYHPDPEWNTIVMILIIPVALFHLLIESLWPIALTFFAFCGGFWNLYWLYTPMLLDIAFQVNFLSFLFHALSLNVTKIAYTVLLACLCLWFYSVIATLYFYGQYDLDGHFGCENVVACFKLHLDYGLYNVPNWAGDFYITPELDKELSFIYGRTVLARLIGTVYNVTYVILINLVLQSIISGLIIDTFSKLREENEFTLRDIADKCFICSIPRDDFEQNEIPFLFHVKEEHNMWHYLWFKIYLESKDELTYSSAENYAAEEISEKSSFVRLLPIKRSMTIEQKDQGEVEDFKIDERLDDLETLLTRMQRQQTNAQKSLEFLKKTLARMDAKR